MIKSILCSLFITIGIAQPIVDKGWRWRNSVNITLKRSPDIAVGTIDADAVHEDLYQQEINLTPYVVFDPKKYAPPNTLLAAITVVVEDQDHQIKVLPYQVFSDDGANPLFFTSNKKIQYFDETTQTKISLEWFNPKDYYPTKAILQPFLEKLGHQFRSSSNPNLPVYTDQHFNHSENKLLYYLLEKEGLKSAIDKAIKAPLTYYNIRAIILHIHSRYDPCENCCKSLHVFKNHARAFLNTHYHIDCPIIVTLSSRTAYEHVRDMEGFDANSPPPPLLQNSDLMLNDPDTTPNLHTLKPDLAQPYKFLGRMP